MAHAHGGQGCSAGSQGVRPRLYLHTQPFLPGAVAFWQARGLQATDREADPVWQTLHLERRIGPGAG